MKRPKVTDIAPIYKVLKELSSYKILIKKAEAFKIVLKDFHYFCLLPLDQRSPNYGPRARYDTRLFFVSNK